MTSKERVRTTLHCGQADRVPVNYSSNPDIHRRLMAHYNVTDDESLLQALGVDIRRIIAPYKGPRLHPEPEEPNLRRWPDWGLQNRYVEHGTGGYWEPWGAPLEDMDEEMAATYPMPSPDDYDYDAIKPLCEQWKDYGVGIHATFETMNFSAQFVGDIRMYTGLATSEPAYMTLLNRIIDIKLEILRRSLEAAPEGAIDFVWLGEDLGTQRGPRISMDLFREKVRPIQERFIAVCKEFGVATMIHCCGSSSWAFEDFIEMGINAAETLQPEAANMDPAYLKKQFGGRLAFHGCISTAGPLSRGTVDETIEHCKNTLEIMKPGGGYCFAPTHMIQDNTPTENVVAMYDTVRELGAY